MIFDGVDLLIDGLPADENDDNLLLEIEESDGAYVELNDNYDEGAANQTGSTFEASTGPEGAWHVFWTEDNLPDRGQRHIIETDPVDPQLRAATLTVRHDGGSGNYDDVTVSGLLEWTVPSNIKVWWQRDGRWVEVDDEADYRAGQSEALWIEGIAVDSGNGQSGDLDVLFTPSWHSALSDKAKVTTIKLDADVDSNNDGEIETDADSSVQEDDFIEYDTDRLGVVVPLNARDRDFDGIVDFADGFNRTGDSRDDFINDGGGGTMDDFGFTEYVLTIPSDVDPAATITIDYSFSHPDDIETIDNRLDVSNSSGHLRLWTEDNDLLSSRDSRTVLSGGHLVESETAPDVLIEYTLGQLGLTPGASKTFYIEGVRLTPAADLDARRLTVAIDPDGPVTGDYGYEGYVALDELLVSVVDLVSITTVDAYGAEGVDAADGAGEEVDDAVFTVSRGEGNTEEAVFVYYEVILPPDKLLAGVSNPDQRLVGAVPDLDFNVTYSDYSENRSAPAIGRQRKYAAMDRHGRDPRGLLQRRRQRSSRWRTRRSNGTKPSNCC